MKINNYLKNYLNKIPPTIIIVIPNIITDIGGIVVFSCFIIPMTNKKYIKIERMPININHIPVFLVSLLSITEFNNKRGNSFILFYHNIKYKSVLFKIFLKAK